MPESSSRGRNLSTVQTAFKAVAFLSGQDGAEAPEVARHLGKSLSSAYALLASLVTEGVVERRGNRYRATGRVGFDADSPLQVVPNLRLEHALDELHLATNERACLALWRGDGLQVSTRGKQGLAKPVGLEGNAQSWHALALGKAVLAFLPGVTLEHQEFRPLTAHTITDGDALEEELERVRRSGLALELEEFALGFSAVACPVFGGRGEVVGALGVVAPASRFPFAFARLVRAVREVSLASSLYKPPVVQAGLALLEAGQVVDAGLVETQGAPSAAQPSALVVASALRENAALQDVRAESLAASQDPQTFWANWARRFVWFAPWSKTLEWNAPHHRWFVGATTNVVFNALDRHVQNGRRNQLALVVETGEGKTLKYSYRELLVLVSRLASGLRSLGVGVGDRVAVYLPTGLEAAATMLACARLGAVHVVLPAGIGVAALRERLVDTGAKLLVAADRSYRNGRAHMLSSIVEEAVQGLPLRVLWHSRGSHRAELEFWPLVETSEASCEAVGVDSEHPLFILYTSGSTGKPKGVVHVHGGYMVGTTYMLRQYFDVKDSETIMTTADLAWIVGHSHVLYAPLLEGLTVVLREERPDQSEPLALLEAMERHGVNVFMTMPTSLRALQEGMQQAAGVVRPTGLRLVASAGETVTVDLWHFVHDQLGVPVLDHWWQTETGTAVLGTPLSGVFKPGCPGVALPGAQVLVVDAEGKDLGLGQQGFLAIVHPAPAMLRGFWGNAPAYAALWRDTPYGARYFTGDLAMLDPDGYVHILGRVDDVIRLGEQRIGTSEIEQVLLAHVAVAESAVIGINTSAGYSVRAFVVLRDAQLSDHLEVRRALETRLKTHLRKHFGPSIAREEIHVVDALPRTKSGKIMRRLLRAETLGQHPGDVSNLEE